MTQFELAGMLYEREAERAFQRQDQIEEAALWCKARYPHKFSFLNTIYNLLMADRRGLSKFGLQDALKTGAVKPSPVLSILTPSQALRLLEAYKRSQFTDPKLFRLRDIEAIEKAESQKRLDETLNTLRQEHLSRKKVL